MFLHSYKVTKQSVILKKGGVKLTSFHVQYNTTLQASDTVYDPNKMHKQGLYFYL